MEAVSRVIFPEFRNGEGQATEVWMMNTDRRDHAGSLAGHDAGGETREIIVR